MTDDPSDINRVSKILPNLFLGPHPLRVKDSHKRVFHECDVVISMLEFVPFLAQAMPETFAGKELIHLRVDDRGSAEESGMTRESLLGWALNLKTLLEDGRKVFVHCQAGISRSPTLVIATLMLMNDWTFDTALAFVQSKRPVSDPNEFFKCILRSL